MALTFYQYEFASDLTITALTQAEIEAGYVCGAADPDSFNFLFGAIWKELNALDQASGGGGGGSYVNTSDPTLGMAGGTLV